MTDDPHDPAMPALPRSTERLAGLSAMDASADALRRIIAGTNCPTCRAGSGEGCQVPRDGGGTEPMNDVHLTRWELHQAALKSARGAEPRRERSDPVRAFQQLAGGGTTMTFTGRCRHCQQSFQYDTLGMSLGGERTAPLTGPQHVCALGECRTMEADQVAEREREEQAAEAADLARRRREAFVKWVPDLYHVKARPGHAAHTSHIIPELAPWTADQSLYLHGPPGSGKTHQVACMMLKVAGRVGMEWYSSRRLIADLLASYSNKRVERPAVFSAACAVQVFVLNDLFAERATAHAVGELGNLIDERYEAGLPIVVTSNLSLAEAAVKYDTRRSDATEVEQELLRITTRLLEMTAPPRGIRHRLDDVDWRTAIAMKAMQDAAEEPTT